MSKGIFKRNITNQLIRWKNSKNRKPLILQGARQVGKTTTIKNFGKENYKNIAYFSLEKQGVTRLSEYASIFEKSKDPHRIIRSLELAANTIIKPEKTLIFFDEIQDCPQALACLKYFYEDAPNFHVICAGSLLGVALQGEYTFPVGKVDFLQMYPMTFFEFLDATKNSNLIEYCNSLNKNDKVDDVFHNKLTECLRSYYLVGGMPEVVNCWNETNNIDEVTKALQNLIISYTNDFAKHSSASQFSKIMLVWDSLAKQLAKENKKFTYGAIKSGARAREYEDAIIWLEKAGLVLRMYNSDASSLPLETSKNLSSFKLYLFDVGVLRVLCGAEPQMFVNLDKIFSNFRGAFAENFIIQQMNAGTSKNLYYWERNNPKYEIDVLYQHKDKVVPIEVKADKNIKSLSMKFFAKNYAKIIYKCMRFSLQNVDNQDNFINVPLYLANNWQNYL